MQFVNVKDKCCNANKLANLRRIPQPQESKTRLKQGNERQEKAREEKKGPELHDRQTIPVAERKGVITGKDRVIQLMQMVIGGQIKINTQEQKIQDSHKKPAEGALGTDDIKGEVIGTATKVEKDKTRDFYFTIVPEIADLEWKGKVIFLYPDFTCEEISKVIEAVKVTTFKDVVEDFEDVSTMVLAAKQARWNVALTILSKKPHLVNAIPEERAWAVLHQACLQNNPEIVTKLLENEMCDISVKTKTDRAGTAPPGSTPLQIAEKYNCKKVIPLLENHIAKLKTRNQPPTFVSQLKGNKYLVSGVPYFLLAVSFINEEKVTTWHLYEHRGLWVYTRQIFEFMKTDWKYAVDTVAKWLLQIDVVLFKWCEEVKDFESLCGRLIYIYTSNKLYIQLNDALRRSVEQQHTCDGLHLCLYSLLLESVLLHWENLNTYSGISYRGMTLHKDHIKKYTVGTKYFWLSFTSTTKNEKYAVDYAKTKSSTYGVVFVLDNSISSCWSPREIKDYSINRNKFAENELVYPAGVFFEVTEVEQGRKSKPYKIHAKLLEPPR